MAFKNVNYSDGILGSPWAGFDNFRFLFRTSDAWQITRNTVLYNIIFILLGIFLAVSVAIALHEVGNRIVSKIYQTVIILPNFISMVVISYIVYAFLNTEYGFVNRLLLTASLIREPINWYSEPVYWPFILVIVRMWANVGIGSVIYLAAIAGIDIQLYEAATVDGATRWQQIRNITLPMLRPVMVIILILSLGGIIKADFGLFYQVPMNSALLYPATSVIDTYVYRALTTLNDIGISSATAFYQSVVGFFMVVGANWLVKKIDPEQAIF